MKSLSGPRKSLRIPFGCVIPTAVIAMFINAVFAVNVVSGLITGPTSPPTQDTSTIKSIALTRAWIEQTQTAIALPTSTSIPSSTPTETLTASPVPTLANTSTPMPTATLFFQVLPTQPLQSPPLQSAVCSCSGNSLNCPDFSPPSSAQSCFNYCVGQGVGDIHKLDRDNDGLACEG